MRLLATLSLGLLVHVVGCGGSDPTPQEPPKVAETPEQTAARLFTLAQNLEKEHKTKQAFSTYHQVIRNFPDTPSGKKATERIKRAQKEAMRKVR